MPSEIRVGAIESMKRGASQKCKCLQDYHNGPKFSDKTVWANNIDPD